MWNTQARYGIQLVITNFRNKLNQYKEKLHDGLQITGITTSALDKWQITAVTKPFGTTGMSEAKAFAQYLLGTKVFAKIHHTRKNAIHGHTFQINILLSKLLQQLFYSINIETMELITAKSSEH